MIKVLIVDDEEWIRLGLRVQIDWEGLGLTIIGEAENGAQALELVRKEKPELVITDIRMPIMDGIALMETLSKEFPHISIIVISGYSEFEYVKKALNYKAVDYVLKPIEEEQLSQIVQKTADKIRETRTNHEEWIRLRMNVNENNQLVYDKKWSDFVTSPNPLKHDAITILNNMGIEFPFNYICVICIKVINFNSIAHSKYTGDLELLGFVVKNVLQETLQPFPCAFGFRNYRKKNEFLTIVGIEEDANPKDAERIREISSQLLRTLTGFIGLKVHIGQGRVVQWSDAHLSYTSSLEAAECAAFINGNGIVESETVASLKKDFTFPADLAQTYLYCVENGYQNQAFEAVDAFFQQFKENQTIHPVRIREAVGEWIRGMQKLERKYVHDGSDQEPGIDTEIHPVEWESLQQIQSWIKEQTINTIERIERAKKRRFPDLIEEIVEFMECHYHEAIGLHVVAERFYISAAHLSRVFKQKMGQNFNDYLNRLRIDRACELLRDEDLRVSDIAEMTGFENANYFMRKFKELTGFTPSEYKKNIKKL